MSGYIAHGFILLLAGLILVGTYALYLFIVDKIALGRDFVRGRDLFRPPKVTREQGIKLLQIQIAEGQKLLSNCSITSSNSGGTFFQYPFRAWLRAFLMARDYKAWEWATEI